MGAGKTGLAASETRIGKQPFTGANRVKILFTKMGSEGDLIGSPNAIQINLALLMA